jgi:hypothetical protein
MRRVLAACAIAVVAALTGCTTTPKVYSDSNSAVNFGAFKTFAVLTPKATGGGIDPGVAMRLSQPIQQTVREVLTAKGMSEVAREQANFVVSVRGESVPKVEVTDMGYTAYPYGVSRAGWNHYGGYGYGGYAGYNAVQVNNTNDRRLIVEIFDNASKQEAWVGWIERTSSAPVDTEKVLEGLRLILGGFPPGSQAQ